jgi:hypothetical protein
MSEHKSVMLGLSKIKQNNVNMILNYVMKMPFISVYYK